MMGVSASVTVAEPRPGTTTDSAFYYRVCSTDVMAYREYV